MQGQFLLGWLLFFKVAYSQLSAPIATDAHVSVANNKFLQRQEKQQKFETTDEDVNQRNFCPQNIALRWMSESGSSVYATPLITDLFSDGKKDIIVPTFVHQLEVIEGEDGGQAPGFPVRTNSYQHGSPLMYDIDQNGIKDIMVVTYNGEVLFFTDEGEQMNERLYVPRLRIAKKWYEGLDQDHIDHEHPDVGQQEKEGENEGAQRHLLQEQQGGGLSEEGQQSFVDLWDDDDDYDFYDRDYDFHHYDGHYDDSGAHIDFDEFHQDLDHYRDWDFDYWDHLDEDYYWDEYYFSQGYHNRDSKYVYVDSHVFCTPAIGDIDGDGDDELVIAVTYLYDRDYYDNPERKKELDPDIDISKYIANSIVVFNLKRRIMKWEQQLDQTTDHISYRAYSYSAPTLADVDGDGKLEIIVGSSTGFLYVLNSEGKTLEGWPIQMGDIQGQVGVADVNSDKKLEIVAGDMRGNIAVFNVQGKEVWERHLVGGIPQGPTFGDIDGDGVLDIAVATKSGFIYALRGTDGKDLSNFPFLTGGPIMSQVLITRLQDAPQQNLMVQSFDGFLYVVDGLDGCSDTVDIGEVSYSMVLADDLTGNGKLDLLVSTMNGNLYAYETPADYHPLRSWQYQSANNQLSRFDWEGVYADAASRAPQDVMGQKFQVKFNIIDKRPYTGGPYTVKVMLQGVGIEEMNMGNKPVIGMSESYSEAGSYMLEIPCPRSRVTATVHIEMRDELGTTFQDDYSVSFHIHFHRLLKWLIILPFTFMVGAIFLYLPMQNSENLPS